MASKHEVIGPEAPIPVLVFPRNKMDVIFDCLFHRTPMIMRLPVVNETNNRRNAEREEKDMCPFGIFGAELANLHMVNEISLHCVYALAWTVVKNGRLSFFIDKYLKLFFHFQVAPGVIMKMKCLDPKLELNIQNFKFVRRSNPKQNTKCTIGNRIILAE